MGQNTEQIGAEARPGVPEDETPTGPTTEELTEQLSRAEAQAAEYLDNWRRAAADLSNARKRMQREQAEFHANATARVMERLLPIVEDVDRALSALAPDEADREWVNGFRLIQQKLHSLLQSEGVTPIAAEGGEMFDPVLHHAVTHEEALGYEEGQIIGEVSRGFKLGERVLRPSMVRVARQPEQGSLREDE